MWHDARTLNLLANALAGLAALILLSAGLVWVAKQPYFNLTVIELEVAPGVASSSAAHIASPLIASPLPLPAAIAAQCRGNFFTLNLAQVRQWFESAAWVHHATVHRIWPNTLRVHLDLQQPLALWNDAQMINTAGDVFNGQVADLSANVTLPHFYAPPGSETLVMQRYAELRAGFMPLKMQINTLTLSSRYAWRVTLSQGLELDLGRDPDADAPYPNTTTEVLPFTARVARFVQAWPTVMQKLQGRTLLRADLRYPNGFALALAPLPKTPSTLTSPLKKH